MLTIQKLLSLFSKASDEEKAQLQSTLAPAVSDEVKDEVKTEDEMTAGEDEETTEEVAEETTEETIEEDKPAEETEEVAAPTEETEEQPAEEPTEQPTEEPEVAKPELIEEETPVMEKTPTEEEPEAEMPADYDSIIDGLNAKILALQAENDKLRAKTEGAFGYSAKPDGRVKHNCLYDDCSDIKIHR